METLSIPPDAGISRSGPQSGFAVSGYDSDGRGRRGTGESEHSMFLVRTWTLPILLLFTNAGIPLLAGEGSSPGWPLFVDISENAGVPFVHRASATPKKFLLETMGSGVALLDYDGDGFLDVYLLNGARLTPGMVPGSIPEKSTPEYWNRLYRNNGNGTFSDTTEAAGMAGRGYAMGVAVGDYDNDGRPDLYVTNYPSNQLFRNQGDGTFGDVTATAGVSGGGWSSSAGFFDYDRDGDLDLFVCRYMQWDFDDVFCGRSNLRAYCDPKHFRAISNLLYRNDGDGTFTDATDGSGVGAHPSKGLGVAFNDFDRDGRPDVVVANDGVPQSLFLNQGNGSFREEALLKGLAFDEDGNTFAGMGVDFADYDQDGWPDVLITTLSLETYALFRNLSGRAFDYVSKRSGVAAATRLYSGWGTFFFDADNDGRKDIFVAQGHVMDTIESTNSILSYLQPPLLLRNRADVFEDVSAESGRPFWKLPCRPGSRFRRPGQRRRPGPRDRQHGPPGPDSPQRNGRGELDQLPAAGEPLEFRRDRRRDPDHAGLGRPPVRPGDPGFQLSLLQRRPVPLRSGGPYIHQGSQNHLAQRSRADAAISWCESVPRDQGTIGKDSGYDYDDS